MHQARHSAGQHVLDRTGNLKAVRKRLRSASRCNGACPAKDCRYVTTACVFGRLLWGCS